MKRRFPVIKQRKPIFLGCEGESEQGYGQFLNDLVHASGLAIHIEVVNLSPGAGDPIARLHRARKEIERRQLRRSDFALKAVLLDSDQVADNANRRQDTENFARQYGIRILWQEPCHEAFLLRHLEGHTQRRPPTANVASDALQIVWPQYSKPMTKLLLARRIGLSDVQRAASVEAALAEFLREIGLLA